KGSWRLTRLNSLRLVHQGCAAKRARVAQSRGKFSQEEASVAPFSAKTVRLPARQNHLLFDAPRSPCRDILRTARQCRRAFSFLAQPACACPTAPHKRTLTARSCRGVSPCLDEMG